MNTGNGEENKATRNRNTGNTGGPTRNGEETAERTRRHGENTGNGGENTGNKHGS
jgi:hypothetical protein